jgi:hypothetical protein
VERADVRETVAAVVAGAMVLTVVGVVVVGVVIVVVVVVVVVVSVVVTVVVGRVVGRVVVAVDVGAVVLLVVATVVGRVEGDVLVERTVDDARVVGWLEEGVPTARVLFSNEFGVGAGFSFSTVPTTGESDAPEGGAISGARAAAVPPRQRSRQNRMSNPRDERFMTVDWPPVNILFAIHILETAIRRADSVKAPAIAPRGRPGRASRAATPVAGGRTEGRTPSFRGVRARADPAGSGP